jgi:hypothetical protein
MYKNGWGRGFIAVVCAALVLQLGACASKRNPKDTAQVKGTQPSKNSSGKVIAYGSKDTIVAPQFGEMSYVLERAAKAEGCTTQRGAELLRTDGAVERYKISCTVGNIAYAYCESRQCRLSSWTN